MNTRIGILLVVAVLLLGGIFYLVVNRGGENGPAQAHALLPRIEPAGVKSLVIARGSERVKLVNSDGRWAVEDRGGYTADTSKVTALMLKLFDLHVSESTKVLNPDLASLGLADDSYKQGFVKLTLLHPDQSEIVSIFTGQGRKQNAKAFAKPSGGQYIRSSQDPNAYLIPDQFSISAIPKSWIDSNLVNVLQASIYAVVQFEMKDGVEQEKFRMIRTDLTKDDVPIAIEIKPGSVEGKTFEGSVLSQLRAILENTKIDDVFPANDSEVSDLKFDRLTRVITREGVVYSVYTAEKGPANQHRIFARIEVSFDQTIVDEVKSALLTTPRGADQKEMTVAAASGIQQINELFKPWVYELPPYQGQKFRFSLNDLFVVSRPINILKRE